MILDITRHPCDASSILTWLVAMWDHMPNEPLLVVTHDNDGTLLVNRVRVKLSQARRRLKVAGVKRRKEFGLSAQVRDWMNAELEEQDAVLFTRRVTRLHQLSEMIQDTRIGP